MYLPPDAIVDRMLAFQRKYYDSNIIDPATTKALLLTDFWGVFDNVRKLADKGYISGELPPLLLHSCNRLVFGNALHRNSGIRTIGVMASGTTTATWSSNNTNNSSNTSRCCTTVLV